LRGVKEEAASYKGKAMQQAQALEKATAAITKGECEIRRLKPYKEKPKARVEGGEGEGEEEATASTATVYRRAEGLKDSILGVVGKSVGTFGRVWAVVMRNKNVVDAFSKAHLKPYHNEADVRDSELVRLSGAARCLSSHGGGRDDGAGHALQHHGLCYELLAQPLDRDAVGVFREEPDDPAAGGGVVSGPYG
jgi:hypothetical protein